MLTIGKDQMRALERERRLAFEARLLARLRSRPMPAAIDADDLAAFVSKAIDQALRCLVSQADVARYVDIMLSHRDRWPTGELPAQAQAMLRGGALTGSRRLDNLERWVARWSASHGR